MRRALVIALGILLVGLACVSRLEATTQGYLVAWGRNN